MFSDLPEVTSIYGAVRRTPALATHLTQTQSPGYRDKWIENRFSRRLSQIANLLVSNLYNRRPPGTASRAGACPSAAAYPRRRALPAPGPRSRSAAAATSSACVSDSSAQRRRLRRLLPWWRSRLRSPFRRRRRRRRRARDASEGAHWPGRGAGPAAAGKRKARPLARRAPPPRALCRT